MGLLSPSPSQAKLPKASVLGLGRAAGRAPQGRDHGKQGFRLDTGPLLCGSAAPAPEWLLVGPGAPSPPGPFSGPPPSAGAGPAGSPPRASAAAPVEATATVTCLGRWVANLDVGSPRTLPATPLPHRQQAPLTGSQQQFGAGMALQNGAGPQTRNLPRPLSRGGRPAFPTPGPC